MPDPVAEPHNVDVPSAPDIETVDVQAPHDDSGNGFADGGEHRQSSLMMLLFF